MPDLNIPLQLQVFLCGFAGSAMVEVLTILRYYQTPGRFPMRYKKTGFWVTRTALAIGGGFFAFLYNPASLLLAAHIGVSTPLLIATLAETLPEDSKNAQPVNKPDRN